MWEGAEKSEHTGPMYMHVHVSYLFVMRTTVELSDESRAKLMELAARRGERGFSALVEEAVVRYLAEEDERRRLSERAREVLGTLDEDTAHDLASSIEALRRRWRTGSWSGIRRPPGQRYWPGWRRR